MIRVAIDGPAGVGKSSTSKALAKYFGYAYLDTGAMYRACAWWCLKQDIDLDAETVDERVITEAVGEFFTGDHFDISVDPDNPRVFADDEDISEAIRSSEVSSHVSKVSNVIPVRNVLIAALHRPRSVGRLLLRGFGHRGRGPRYHHRGVPGRRGARAADRP